MRWYVDDCNPPEPKIGDTKAERSFLWWPITIDDETRWLETASIIYEYVDHRKTISGVVVINSSKIQQEWVPIRWNNI